MPPVVPQQPPVNIPQQPTTMRPVTQPPIVTTAANLPPIDPGDPDFEDNLRGNVYTPGEDARLDGARGATDAASRAVQTGQGYTDLAGAGTNRYRSMFGAGQVGARAVNTQVQAGPDVNAEDEGRYLSEQDRALQGLNGPSRTELAQQALRDFEAQGERNLQQRFRRVGQAASKFGRIGMGDVNAELGSIQGDFERDRLEKANELARQVSEGDIGDRFRRVDAVSGLRGQESAIGAGLRGESRVERQYDTDLSERNVNRNLDDRDYRTNLDVGNEARAFDRGQAAVEFGGRDADRTIGDRYDRLSAATGLEDRVFGQGQDNRNEFRSERQYQQGASQQSLDNRIRERAIAEQERSNRLARAIALMQAGGQTPPLDSLLTG